MWYTLIGNAVYYAVGIALAFAFRDNRAFCKYLCPITIFLKASSRFSLMRVEADPKNAYPAASAARSADERGAGSAVRHAR